MQPVIALAVKTEVHPSAAKREMDSVEILLIIGEEEILTWTICLAVVADSSDLPHKFRQTLAFELSVHEADNAGNRKRQDQQNSQQNPTPWNHKNHTIVLDAEWKSPSYEIQYEKY